MNPTGTQVATNKKGIAINVTTKAVILLPVEILVRLYHGFFSFNAL